MNELDKRKREIEERIQAACDRAGRERSSVQVIAVTKSISTERTEEVVRAGYGQLGENRPEGLMEKGSHFPEKSVEWHFIGNVQSRRVKDILPHAQVIHSLQTMSVAKQIEKRAERVIDCFVQVNTSEEDSKSGLAIDEVKPFIEQLQSFERLRVVGLMTMAPFTKDEAIIRQTFRTLATLQREIEALQLQHAPCHFLSMGMSNDFEIAIEEGATHIRIGTALVGSESGGSV